MAKDDATIEFLGADLAPGDTKALQVDPREFDVARICTPDDPLFEQAFAQLWAEFGAHDTVEPREVLLRRLAWHPATATRNEERRSHETPLRAEDCWLRYEMILVRRAGQFVAVRDHSAIVVGHAGAAAAVVHLSHVFVDPAWRRTGLAGWLRAWPIQTAQACLAAAGFSTDGPITLVAEMEHPELPGHLPRLQAYEKAGFSKIDPAAIKYFQPDFRPPQKIDASGGPRPLPFGLIVRRVGREQERSIKGYEVILIVGSLYRMYGTGFREQDMKAVWESFRHYPAPGTDIALVPPTR